jgi:4'-phosphopantetheinyl transferase
MDTQPSPRVRVVLAMLDGQGDETPPLADAVERLSQHPAQALAPEGSPPPVSGIAVHPVRHWAEAQALLSPAEADRAARLRDFRDRQTYVFAHAALRLLLAPALGAQPKAEFATGAHGKPRLPGGEAVHFNLSYRRGMVALAIGDAPLGVDIEVVRPGIDMLGIGQRFFTGEEQAFLQAPPSGDVAARFFGLWTRKEALVKAAGLGVDFMPAAGALKCRATLADEYGTVKPYCVHQLASTGNYALALAVELSHPPA